MNHRRSCRWNKITFGVILLVMFMANTGVALGDLIFTPKDEFYKKHENECEYVSKNYIINGQKGSAKIYENPQSKVVVAEILNGIQAYISVSYQDKNETLWGRIEYYEDTLLNQHKKDGWIKMSDLQQVYDNQTFYEEHAKEFKKYNGEFDHFEIKDIVKEQIILWEYPGSESIREKRSFLDPLRSISYTYKDSMDRLWGYYSLTEKGNDGEHKGYSALWICISDPTNMKLSAISYQPTIIPPVTESTGNNLKVDQNSTILLIAIPIVVLIVITGLMIKLFWKKKE